MHIEHIALQVNDPVAMADWYVKNFGFTVARAGGAPTFTHFLKSSTGVVMIEIYRHPSVGVPDYSKQDPLTLHLAFLSDNPAADRDRLVKAGARIAEDVTTTPHGDEILMLRDPWNIPIQFVKRTQPMLSRKF
jgi:glyoxylase I family protein